MWRLRLNVGSPPLRDAAFSRNLQRVRLIAAYNAIAQSLQNRPHTRRLQDRRPRVPDLKSHRAPLLVCMAIILASPLAGCGRRGALEPAESDARASASQTGASQTRAATAGAEEGEPAAPQRPFILDAIL